MNLPSQRLTLTLLGVAAAILLLWSPWAIQSGSYTMQSGTLVVTLIVLAATFGLTVSLFFGLTRTNHTIHNMQERHRDSLKSSRESAVANATSLIAHDVRKPFTMMRALLEMLADAENLEQVHQITDSNLAEIEQAMTLVNQLLRDVMIASSGTAVVLNPVSLQNLLQKAIADSVTQERQLDITFEYHFSHDCMILADLEKAPRIFSCLIENAIQMMGACGKITFESRLLSNNGIPLVGITLKHPGADFGRFDTNGLTTLFAGKTKIDPQQLRLGVASQLVNAHGCALTCTSDAPNGFIFDLTLPAASSKIGDSNISLPLHSRAVTRQTTFDSKDPSAPLKSTSSIATDARLNSLLQRHSDRKFVVLVLDDEPLYRNSIVDKLRRTAGLEDRLTILEAETADQAWEIIQKERPILGIFDIDLGAKSSQNGLELVRRVRNSNHDFFICMHTNRVVEGDTKAAVESGADTYVPKPMGRTQLLKLLCLAIEKNVKDDSRPSVAVLDDSFIFLTAWKRALNDCSVHTFESPERFLEKFSSDSEFAKELSLVIADQHYGSKSLTTGTEFAREFVKKFDKPVFISSNAEASDLGPMPSKMRVIGKDAIPWQHLEKLLHGLDL